MKNLNTERDSNPYQPPRASLEEGVNEKPVKKQRFSYFLFGILPGGLAGLTYLGTVNYLADGNLSGFILFGSGIGVMAVFVSGIVGMIYAGFMAIIAYQFNIVYRKLVHGFAWVMSSFIVSIVVAYDLYIDWGLIEMITGFLFSIIPAFVIALATAKKNQYYKIVKFEL